MSSERLNALCESIEEEGTSPLVKQLIELLEERGLLTPIVMRDWTGVNPWPNVLLYHRGRGWNPEEIHRMRLNGDDSIHKLESCGGGDDDSSSGGSAKGSSRSTAGYYDEGTRAKAGPHRITNPDRVIAIINEGRTTITQQRGALGTSPRKHPSRGPHHRSK